MLSELHFSSSIWNKIENVNHFLQMHSTQHSSYIRGEKCCTLCAGGGEKYAKSMSLHTQSNLCKCFKTQEN